MPKGTTFRTQSGRLANHCWMALPAAGDGWNGGPEGKTVLAVGGAYSIQRCEAKGPLAAAPRWRVDGIISWQGQKRG